MIVPEEIYTIVWHLESGYSMVTMTNRGAYEAWQQAPVLYADKRLKRWNNHAKPGKRAKSLRFCTYKLIGAGPHQGAQP